MFSFHGYFFLILFNISFVVFSISFTKQKIRPLSSNFNHLDKFPYLFNSINFPLICYIFSLVSCTNSLISDFSIIFIFFGGLLVLYSLIRPLSKREKRNNYFSPSFY